MICNRCGRVIDTEGECAFCENSERKPGGIKMSDQSRPESSPGRLFDNRRTDTESYIRKLQGYHEKPEEDGASTAYHYQSKWGKLIGFFVKHETKVSKIEATLFAIRNVGILILVIVALMNFSYIKSTFVDSQDEYDSLGVSKMAFSYFGNEKIGDVLNYYCMKEHSWENTGNDANKIKEMWDRSRGKGFSYELPCVVVYSGTVRSQDNKDVRMHIMFKMYADSPDNVVTEISEMYIDGIST